MQPWWDPECLQCRLPASWCKENQKPSDFIENSLFDGMGNLKEIKEDSPEAKAKEETEEEEQQQKDPHT